MSTSTVRPTKKQRELLDYIEQFIIEHGYSPSYREVMNGLDYTSVATVSLHINSLIRRGHLRKRDRSARSLEVVKSDTPQTDTPATAPNAEEAWLASQVDAAFKRAEAANEPAAHSLQDLQTVLDSMRILGHRDIAERYEPKLDRLKRLDDEST